MLIKPRNGPVVAINGDGMAPELATAAFYESVRRDDPRVALRGTYAGSPGGDWSNPTSPTMVEYDSVTGVISAGAGLREYRDALAW